VKKILLVLFVAALFAGCSESTTAPSTAAAQVERPSIVGVANFVAKTDSLKSAREFYNGDLGYEEAFLHKRPGIEGDIAAFKVNDRQFIELSPTLQNEDEDKLIQLGFETTDAKQLRDYLAQQGIDVPATVELDPDGNLSFRVMDPEGHRVEFVQYLPDSVQMKDQGQHLSDDRISDNILHVGADFKDEAKADAFYKTVLGFRPLWRGGMKDDRADWISLLVPNGSNWIEYMMWQPGHPPDPNTLGVWNHVCVGTTDIQKVWNTVVSRGYKGNQPPSIGRDGRWLLHLYDQHHTRTEVMVRKPVETPCCGPMDDPYTD
jgi:catechol 2,3-dioxygenase-like lactoylglutathione lyase family enzyme